MKIDLHIHSKYSDGMLSPEEIIDICVKDNVGAIALTDHDNVLGIEPLKKAASGKNVEIIPGVEINTVWKKHEIHVLGYYMDLEDDIFKEVIETQQSARINQAEEIIKLLNSKARISIKMSDITKQIIPGGCIGRPHIARAIFQKGAARNIQEAYIKYINDNAPTYLRRNTITPHEAVEAIYESGGIPVIAHPRDMEDLENIVKDLMSYGLRGLEAYHRSHTPAIVEYLSTLAEDFDLIVTGGSDCHGPRGSIQYTLGKTLVPDWVLTKLKEEKARLDSASYKAS